MEKRYNPLENWRGSRSPYTAAYLLNLTPFEYRKLESHPERSTINSDQIILIAQELGIPLAALVDYLTETNAREVVSC